MPSSCQLDWTWPRCQLAGQRYFELQTQLFAVFSDRTRTQAFRRYSYSYSMPRVTNEYEYEYESRETWIPQSNHTEVMNENRLRLAGCFWVTLRADVFRRLTATMSATYIPSSSNPPAKMSSPISVCRITGQPSSSMSNTSSKPSSPP